MTTPHWEATSPEEFGGLRPHPRDLVDACLHHIEYNQFMAGFDKIFWPWASQNAKPNKPIFMPSSFLFTPRLKAVILKTTQIIFA
jgi:hypothetical protein